MLLKKMRQVVVIILMLSMFSGCMTYAVLTAEDEDGNAKDVSTSQITGALVIDGVVITVGLLVYGIYCLFDKGDDAAEKKGEEIEVQAASDTSCTQQEDEDIIVPGSSLEVVDL